MPSGTVKWFNATKGYGFIQPDNGGKDVFIHVTALESSGMKSLNEGQRVNFEVMSDQRGEKATTLTLAD
ncbi:MAG: cold-shock protein [Alphaproteobacteria bacterium]|nr:cold-shock protein [Alphaproteobacteria bacterium]